MGLEYLNNVINDTIEKLKGFLKQDIIVGETIVTSNTTVIPIQKITAGFVTGAFDMKCAGNGEVFNQPISTVGGGVSATPIGFLVISNGKTEYIKADIEEQISPINGIIKKTIDRLSKS
ncbi:MAG: hypothetical protein LBF68_05805 [Christensenellaceae bacterium]|jgi:uncharacterized spore protein YtfJ|nr:hypothetical protein [Christensenellaceae bacterium]